MSSIMKKNVTRTFSMEWVLTCFRMHQNQRLQFGKLQKTSQNTLHWHFNPDPFFTSVG